MIMSVCTWCSRRDMVKPNWLWVAQEFSKRTPTSSAGMKILNTCFINNCDSYSHHEYLGNTPRLSITALTDGAITLTKQSLHFWEGLQ
jgi:hypothetical protein